MEWLLEQSSGNADSDVFSFNQLSFFLPGREERGEATGKIDNLERFGRVKCEETEAIKDDEKGKSSDDESEEDDSSGEALDEEESTGDEDAGCYEDETIKRRCSQARVEVGSK